MSDYRYLPDLNFYGSNQMSVAYVDQDGFTEFRHVHLEVRNTQDPTLFSGNIQVGSEEDHIYRGTVWALDFDGLAENAFQEGANIKSDQANLEDGELNGENADALDALVSVSRGLVNHLTNVSPEEDASTEMGHFDDTDADLVVWKPFTGEGNNEWTPTSNRFGRAHKAMRLNSGSDAIELEASHFESSNDVSTPFTLSFWFTSDTADNHLKTLMTNGIEGGGRLDAVLQEDSLTLKLDSSVYRIPVRDHSWNHFVMVVAPSEGAKKVYMNGKKSSWTMKVPCLCWGQPTST